jgi:glycosyltransferase involved in cell wall biosynthesis
MRILLVSHRFPRHSVGGTEVLTEDTARWLAARGHAVLWLAVGQASQPEIDRRMRSDGIEEWEVSPASPADYPVGWSNAEGLQKAKVEQCYKRFLFPQRIDAVHVFHFARIGLRFLELDAFRNATLVATLTDYTAVCADYQLRDRRTGIICSGDVIASECAKCIGVHSTATAERDLASWRARNVTLLSEHFNHLFVQTPHQRAVLQRLGMNGGPFRGDRAAYHVPSEWALRSEAGKSKYREYVFAFIGRSSEEKGLDVALDAFLELQSEPSVSRCRLKIVSPEPPGVDVPNPCIDWLGSMPHASLGEFLQNADCLLIPSIWLENHPMVLTYALELRISVLCSDLPSLRHLRGTPNLHFVQVGNVTAWRDAMEHLRSTPMRRPPHPTSLPPFGKLAATAEDCYRARP